MKSTLRFRLRALYWRWIYPLDYAWRWPVLAVCVWVNYRLRGLGLLPDRWYDKDVELLKRIGGIRQIVHR